MKTVIAEGRKRSLINRRIDNDSIVCENILSLHKDFSQTILAEEWIEEGYEIVPCQ